MIDQVLNLERQWVRAHRLMTLLIILVSAPTAVVFMNQFGSEFRCSTSCEHIRGLVVLHPLSPSGPFKISPDSQWAYVARVIQKEWLEVSDAFRNAISLVLTALVVGGLLFVGSVIVIVGGVLAVFYGILTGSWEKVLGGLIGVPILIIVLVFASPIILGGFILMLTFQAGSPAYYLLMVPFVLPVLLGVAGVIASCAGSAAYECICVPVQNGYGWICTILKR